MIRPIFLFGQPVLRKVAQPIDASYPQFEHLVQDMFDTMYHAGGVGLAAPQIGLDIRLFIVDGAPFQERKGNTEDMLQFKKVFINPEIVEEWGDKWGFEEGCLSIPDLRDTVMRHAELRLRYLDEHFQPQEAVFKGLQARIIQHEYDHLNGVLFFDHLSPLKRQLLKGKLNRIARGEVEPDYPYQAQNRGNKR